MQNLADITKWELVPQGVALEFLGRNPRPVTLHFNAGGKAAVYIHLASEETPRLLALVEGRDTVTFATDGAFSVMNKTPDVDLYVLTRDGSKVHRVNLDAEAFTTLHQPRAKDENLERILEKMNRSANIRAAQERAVMQAAYEKALADERSKHSSATPAPAPQPATGETPDAGPYGQGEPDPGVQGGGSV